MCIRDSPLFARVPGVHGRAGRGRARRGAAVHGARVRFCAGLRALCGRCLLYTSHGRAGRRSPGAGQRAVGFGGAVLRGPGAAALAQVLSLIHIFK